MKAHINGLTSISPLGFFRVVFGLLMLISLLRFASHDWVQQLYIDPSFLFSYYGFDFLPRPSSAAVWIVFFICLFATVGIMLGAFYRWSATVFFITFVYLELLDKANYLNHYYFISLLAFLMIFLPANRAFSLDVKRGRVKECTLVKGWNILSIKLLIGGLYFMAGLAKLHADWLLEALPMRIWLPAHSSLPLIGPLMDETWLAYLFSWSGALYDLSIPFLLFFTRTRKWAYASVLLFHVFTAMLFQIGMFPYVMISVSLIFFPASIHECILTLGGRWHLFLESAQKKVYHAGPVLKKLSVSALVITFFLVFIFPLRSLAYPGPVQWHEQGYRFSWRVMLMEKAGYCFFYVKDPLQKGEIEVDNRLFLTANQEKQMSTQPDMILQFAQLIDAHYQQEGIANPEVRVEAWVSLNGRGSRLFIDPFCDLSKVKEGWANKDWILPFDSVVTASQLVNLKAQVRQ